jgi:DNA primase
MQSDMNFKVDKDVHQQDLDDKLDRTEFINRMTENNNVQDTIVQLEYNFKGLAKQLKETEEATEKGYKKTKKLVEAKFEEAKTNVQSLERLVSTLEVEIKSKPSVGEGQAA